VKDWICVTAISVTAPAAGNNLQLRRQFDSEWPNIGLQIDFRGPANSANASKNGSPASIYAAACLIS
jgi:hypothetical protein